MKSLSLAGPSIDEVLQHPKAKKKVTRGQGMPSHLTGEQVMQYLTEKERMKKEAEEALLKRKEERAARKAQKEKEAIEKRAVKMKKGIEKKAAKAKKAKGVTVISERDEESDQSEHCPVCKMTEDDDEEDTQWIQCDNHQCSTWYHVKCAGIDSDNLDDIQWYCETCIAK